VSVYVCVPFWVSRTLEVVIVAIIMRCEHNWNWVLFPVIDKLVSFRGKTIWFLYAKFKNFTINFQKSFPNFPNHLVMGLLHYKMCLFFELTLFVSKTNQLSRRTFFNLSPFPSRKLNLKIQFFSTKMVDTLSSLSIFA
jgi:hypothetical protein